MMKRIQHSPGCTHKVSGHRGLCRPRPGYAVYTTADGSRYIAPAVHHVASLADWHSPVDCGVSGEMATITEAWDAVNCADCAHVGASAEDEQRTNQRREQAWQDAWNVNPYTQERGR